MSNVKKVNNKLIEPIKSTKPTKPTKPNTLKKKKKRANRTSYKDWLSEDKLLLIEGWARDGLSDEQIAHNIGIRRETLWDWKKKYSHISNSLKKGKEVVDFQVENALLKRALGYEYEEVTTEEDSDGRIKTKRTTKMVLPDTIAQIFWLKNRKPDKWKDRIENKQEVTVQQAPATDAIMGALLKREIEE